MSDIAVLLAAAATGFGIARWLGLPPIPFLVLCGIAANYLLELPAAFLEDAIVLGITFLVFVAGLELNPRRVGAQASAAIKIGVVQFVCLGTAGFAVALALGFSSHAASYIAIALAASSTLVVVRVLQGTQQLFEPFGRLVIGVLLFQDLAVILLLPFITAPEFTLETVAFGVLATLGLVGLAFIALRWATPLLVPRLDADEEHLLLAVLALLFVFIALAGGLGLPLIVGAFLAGVALSPFPVSGIVRGQLLTLRDFFAAIFFTALGGFIAIPTATDLAYALILAALVLLITPPLVTVMAERFGHSARSSIESGLLLAQTSEFSLVVGLQGLVLGHIGQDVFNIIAIVTMLTMALTPLVAAESVVSRLLRLHPTRSRAPSGRPPAGHVLLLGCGDSGMPLLETLVAAGHEVMVVDDDPAVVKRLREGDVPCIRGDGSDPEILGRAGAAQARVIISTMQRLRDSETVLGIANDVPVLVRVFGDDEAARTRELGGQPVPYADAALQQFLRWFEKEQPGNRPARVRPKPLAPTR